MTVYIRSLNLHATYLGQDRGMVFVLTPTGVCGFWGADIEWPTVSRENQR